MYWIIYMISRYNVHEYFKFPFLPPTKHEKNPPIPKKTAKKTKQNKKTLDPGSYEFV